MAQWSFQLGRAMGPWAGQQRTGVFWFGGCHCGAILAECELSAMKKASAVSVVFAERLEEGCLMVVTRLGTDLRSWGTRYSCLLFGEVGQGIQFHEYLEI
jgi:hypothetical protein